MFQVFFEHVRFVFIPCVYTVIILKFITVLPLIIVDDDDDDASDYDVFPCDFAEIQLNAWE